VDIGGRTCRLGLQSRADRHVLPPDHPLRVELNDEVHARPPEALVAPVQVSFLALFSDSSRRETQ
jgi:hypothetical protein